MRRWQGASRQIGESRPANLPNRLSRSFVLAGDQHQNPCFVIKSIPKLPILDWQSTKTPTRSEKENAPSQPPKSQSD